MLSCVCSVIDHRWRQNVVRTKKWHTRRSRVCHWCSYHILTSSVIYYWIRRTATWNLFVLYNNKIFQHNAKPAFCPAFARKKAIWSWRDLWSFQNEAISLVAMRSKELWLVEKIAPLSNLSRASLFVEWKLTANAELNCKIYKSWSRKMLEKSSQFVSSERPCEPKSLDVALKITGVEKIPLENLWLQST